MNYHKFLKVHLTSTTYEIFITDRTYSKQDYAQKSWSETLYITQNKNSKSSPKMISMIIQQSKTH